jgi:hypothetical protein
MSLYCFCTSKIFCKTLGGASNVTKIAQIDKGVRRNYTKLYKITLTGWVDKTLDIALTRKKSYQGSKVFKFDHLTLGPCIQKLALILCTHYRIRLRKKKN